MKFFDMFLEKLGETFEGEGKIIPRMGWED